MTKIRLLLVEDDETDAMLVIRQLKKDGFDVEYVRVKTAQDLESELDKGGYDIMISDYSLPGFSGQQALSIFKSRNLDIPFILVSGTVGEDLAVSIMKGGANDYLMKSSLSRLGPAVSRELEEMKVRIEKKQAQKELIEAKLAAEESSRVKSSLLANMSHEFRTPMNGILGFTEILSSLVSDTSQKEMTSHIQTSAKRLLRTLNSIMTFAELDSGYKPNLVIVNLPSLIENTIEQVALNAKARGLHLEHHLEKGLFIRSDEHLLQESILNLLENAIKFTHSGGVTVELKKNKADGILISVRDTGIGIPAEKQDLIFEEFRQGSEGFNRPYEGSGLGLSITRKSMHLLNYTISLESSVGKGSCFTIVIPSPQEPGTSGPKAGTETSRISSQTHPVEMPYILLVEDNDANIDLVKLFLKKNYRVDVARDGYSAVAMTEKNKYDCILMDINLGYGMDGREAIERIRTNAGYQSVPIIAVTGYTLQNEKEAILARGADFYLPKPFDKTQLTVLLQKIFS